MKRLWSLQVLLPALVLLFLLAATAISVVGGLVERRQTLQNEARADGLRDVSRIAELAETVLETHPKLLANAVSRLVADPRVVAAAVVDEHGHVIYATNRVWNLQPATQLPGFTTDQFERARMGRAPVLTRDPGSQRQMTMMSFAMPATSTELRGLRRGVVYILHDLSRAYAEARATAWFERLPELGLLLLVAALLGWLVHRLVARPMKRMQSAAQAIAAGDFAQHLPQGGPAEIEGLARAFEHMSVRLAGMVERLASDSRRTQAILDNVVDGIITIDAQGTILSFNRAAEHMFGYAASEVMGQNVKLLMPEPYRSEHDHYLADYLRTGRARVIGIGREVMGRRKNGEEFPVDLGISEVHTAGERIFIGRVSDISARKQAEAHINQLNAELEQRVRERTAQLEAANTELEAFAYSVSHDLRTPLRAVDGFSQALLEDYGSRLDATGRNFLQRVRAGAQHMGRLIDDLLKLSRVSRAPLQKTEVDISALAHDIVAHLCEGDPTRQVTVDVADGLRCRADPGLMRIALENLLGNAWKYTSRNTSAHIHVGARCEGDATVFCVVDNGVGFDMRFADKLFGAFQRLHRKEEFEGSGIGLATVARILHRHGGRIWAEATPGQGATFFFTLENDRLE